MSRTSLAVRIQLNPLMVLGVFLHIHCLPSEVHCFTSFNNAYAYLLSLLRKFELQG